MPNNLLPKQYQIEDLVMGLGTPYKMNVFEIMPYGVGAADYQLPRKDEFNFGQDQHSPGPINMTIGLLQNRWVRPMPDGIDLVQANLDHLQRIWRADDVRYEWNKMQEFMYGSIDGSTHVIFGRTDKFQYSKIDSKTESHEVVCSFRRADSLSYSHTKYVSNFLPNVGPQLVAQGTGGTAPSWVEIYLRGPMKAIKFTFADVEFQLDWDIPAGKILEINSYPNQRRCVDSDGINRRANLIGATPYLDRLKFNFNQNLTLKLEANGTTDQSLGALIYRDAFQVIK